MRVPTRPLFSKILLRRLFCSTTMESEEDMLYYSQQKLSSLIEKKGDTNAALKEYLANLKYQPIKDFPTGLEWFNVSEPLSLHKHLKGKIVVLDFFTYCCINCMHIIPDLREIEHEFSVEDGLVVVGVHSAKFENEKISSNILAAVQRYNITHPVVNDSNSVMWNTCDVHCWPTLLILGPNANPIVMLMGEGHKENLQLYIKAALDFYKAKKQISPHSIPFKSAYHLLPDLKGPLLFPGKITSFTQDNEEIFAISDTGNHRILIVDKEGTVLHKIGRERAGFKDGAFKNCSFNAPQGLVFKDKNTLFVADTENHAIRRIDLDKKVVETIVGSGVQGNDRQGGKTWKQQIISSPWDLAIYRTPDMDMTFYPDGNKPVKTVLLIAMAGTHQIWALFLEDTVWWKCTKYTAGTCICIAGSGKEENKNNMYPHAAGFAQPSGLALCNANQELYVADSESSSVRRISLVDGKVTPVVGGDRNPANLFAFGDKDGALFEAKLQHLLGLAISKDEKTLIVADTYNHKLKKVDISENSVTTIKTPVADTTDGYSTAFSEPGGLCVSADGKKIYLADTNNHSIKILNVSSDFKVKSVKNLDIDLTSDQKMSKAATSKHQVVETKPVSLGLKGGKLIFNFSINYVDGLMPASSPDAPQNWTVDLPDPSWSATPAGGSDLKQIDIVVNAVETKNASIDFVFDLITCSANNCLTRKFAVRVPVVFDKKNSQTSIESKFVVDVGPKTAKVK